MSKRLLILMCSIFLIVPLLMMGCGSDGSNGSNGANGINGTNGINGINGTNGAAGPPGPVTATNESCMVCHTTGRIADISDGATTDPTGAATVGMHYNAAYEKPNIAIDNIIVSNVGGQPKVSFHVTKAGANHTTLANSAFRFYAADLVPAGTATSTGPWSTDEFQRWASETGTTVGGILDNTGSATGNYAYTFAQGFGTALALDNAPQYNSAHTQRIAVRISGGNPVANVVGTATNNTAAAVDFIVPADGASTAGLGYVARQFTTIEACRKCHGPELAGAGHGGGYYDVQLCVICHSPTAGNAPQGGVPLGQFMDNNEMWLAAMIHKIHGSLTLPFLDLDDGTVTYPQDIRDCVTCHTASGRTLGAGDNTANWKAHPTAAACGTCHVNANFVTGAGHDGGAQPDSTCFVCHPATGHLLKTVGASVTEAHDTSPEAVLHPVPANVSEFDVTMTLSPVKTFYSAGDNILVTATLVFHGTATGVPTKVYTSPQGAAGIADNILRGASIAAFGPRAEPKPILGLPLPASGLTPQTANLFIGSKLADNTVNTRVLTDNTAFKYNLTIPSGLANGTYGIRLRFADFGYVADNNYKIESWAFQRIQIGNATVEKKLSGDACVNCHGVGDFLDAHDARHAVIFDTDQCNACHDFSGNHADVLNNRVHAVHAASKTGDIMAIDWSAVTYPLGEGWPGGIGRCDICHAATTGAANTTPSALYRSVVHETSCLGCHGDRPGATDHMLQNGGAFGTP